MSTLEEIECLVKQCIKCQLSQTRTNTVFARGNNHAQLMLIGEAPGASEDLKGQPFVGRAGILLDKMLASIELTEQDVYIANILKCRPPNNRDPLPEEISSCKGYLQQQIQLVKPKMILALGRFAGQFLFNALTPLKQLRSKIHYYMNIPFIVTYHPAFLLRSPNYKKDAYQDLLFLKKNLNSLTNPA